MLKKFILILTPLFLLASWEEVAVKGFDVIISANIGDAQNFKNSLNSLIDRASKEYAKSGISEYELDLPQFITKRAGTNSLAIRTMRHSLTQNLSPAIPSLKQILQNKIASMSEEDTRAIMDGNATLAHYIRTNAFDEIYAAIRPHVENLANDTSFAKSYKNAMGSEIGENFVSEFTNELLNDAFDTLVQNENEFRANTNAVFNAIKAIR